MDKIINELKGKDGAVFFINQKSHTTPVITVFSNISLKEKCAG